MTDTHFGRMAWLARMGFRIVPRQIEHKEKGPGSLHMDGDGIRFEPFNGSEPLTITWEEFDRGAPSAPRDHSPTTEAP